MVIWRILTVRLGACAMVGIGVLAPPVAAQTTAVTTYHNDTLRTGWNSSETHLTTFTVGGGTFGLQHSVALDEQVDAQPLVVPNQTIAGKGVHTVVYVVTENDTVYALDGLTGAVLHSRHLGTPVPRSSLPTACPDNGPNVGIASTPAISIPERTLYLVADTFENGTPVYRVHALRLDSLEDSVAPAIIAAAHHLADGSSFTFNPTSSRQRPALLLAGTNLYAAFGSYCDRNSASRGWMLGWNVPSLAPLAHSELTNEHTTAPSHLFLSSIWMSGYGPATVGPSRPIYFVTGNSDPSGTTYNSLDNLAESLVQISPDLSRPKLIFTPSTEGMLDQRDLDFGAGGAMVLPLQSGFTPELIAAEGKDGWLYLIDRAHPGAPPLFSRRVDPCYCGPSYFVGSDGTGRLVTSAGRAVSVWVLNNSASSATTLKLGQQINVPTGQDGGFFTSISSSKTQAGSAVVWAVTRPTDSNPANVMLLAIDPKTGAVMFSSVAGTWPNVGANANIVPTVANGRVYVASNRELTIFGLGGATLDAATQADIQARREAGNRIAASSLMLEPGEHAIFGTVQATSSSVMTIERRNGAMLLVDTQTAGRGGELANPALATAVMVVGTYADNGVLTARYIHRAKRERALWLPDR